MVFQYIICDNIVVGLYDNTLGALNPILPVVLFAVGKEHYPPARPSFPSVSHSRLKRANVIVS